MRYWYYFCGTLMAIVGLAMISDGGAFGDVPKQVTDDTAIYQKLSEIRLPHEGRPNFDADIARLSSEEGRFREKLPSLANSPKLKGPMNRISKQKYRAASAQNVALPTAPMGH